MWKGKKYLLLAGVLCLLGGSLSSTEDTALAAASASAATATTTATAAASTAAPDTVAVRQPLRVARLPLQLEGFMTPGQDVVDALERQIDRATHIPLNGVLQAASFLPEDDCEEALAEACEQAGRRPKLKNIVKPLADKLQADLVIVPVLTAYEEYTTMSMFWDHATLLHARAGIEMVLYDRTADKVIDRRAFRSFDDEYSTSGEASQLARDCMYQVLDETQLHDRMRVRLLAGDSKK